VLGLEWFDLIAATDDASFQCYGRAQWKCKQRSLFAISFSKFDIAFEPFVIRECLPLLGRVFIHIYSFAINCSNALHSHLFSEFMCTIVDICFQCVAGVVSTHQEVLSRCDEAYSRGLSLLSNDFINDWFTKWVISV
jgi:hypothetical protein